MIDLKKYPLLQKINAPLDLRQLSIAQLDQVAIEMRAYLLEALNICGGHFAANLGSVELAISLHYVFNTPEDAVVWDVGHQAYPHKILTGRRDLLYTIKQPNGLAPFPKREESIYDTFGVGHSSTSISAALGMAIAFQQQNLQHKSVAIIGDGGMTGGMAFEALNHAGSIDADLLVILNDNDMSISPNVGALNNYLARVLTGKIYTSLRESSKKVLAKMPPIKSLAKRTESHLKGMITPGTIFEELGFHYFGPIDGHDIKTLVSTLQNLRALKGPQFLHIITTKGKGYPEAEADPVKFHAVKPGFLNPPTSTTSAKPAKLTYSDIFGDWLCDMASIDPKLYAITPAMCEGSGMTRFANEFPAQYCDVGIAEQHSVTLAGGLASQGIKPVVAIYSTFLQRGYDQLIHDIALQNLDVTFAIDRAGLVGADGPTHAGSFDISFLRCIPNMIIMAPSHEDECRQMLYTAYCHNGPAAVRYPRGSGPGVPMTKEMATIPLGSAEILRKGSSIAILGFGSLCQAALQVGHELSATVINMRFIKPIDENLLTTLAQTHHHIITLEENAIAGGAGSAVNEFLMTLKYQGTILNLGLPDCFLEHGIPEQMLADCGLDVSGIIQAINKHISTEKSAKEFV